MMLEHKHSREVSQPLMENGHSDIYSHLENGIKMNGFMNGESKDVKHPYMNGLPVASQVKQIM